MIEVREAVKRAMAYLTEMYSDEMQDIREVRLEEVILSDDDRFWYVTFSFLRLPSSLLAQQIGPPPPREYKLFTIAADTGVVRSMVMKNWYDGPNPPAFGPVPHQGGAR